MHVASGAGSGAEFVAALYSFDRLSSAVQCSVFPLPPWPDWRAMASKRRES